MDKRYRDISQIISILILNSYYLAPIGKNIPLPVFNCYSCPLASFACPIGTLQHFIILREFPFLLLGILLFSGIIMGRYFCGFFCPFGTLQDWLFKIKIPKINLGNKFANIIRWSIFIILVIFIPYITLEPWFCKLCPNGTLTAGIPQVILKTQLRNLIGFLFVIKILILIIFLILCLLIYRFFCRYICPLGTILSIFNGISFKHLEIRETCKKCVLCTAKCPVNIEVYKEPNSPNCIRCLECTDCKDIISRFSL